MSAEDINVGRSLLAEWEAKLTQTFGEEGSIVRLQIEEGLKEAEARVHKVAQAGELGQQIDKLPEGTVKAHMNAALRQLEGELGIAVASSGSAGGAGQAPRELKVIVQKFPNDSQSFVLQDLHPDTTIGVLKVMVEAKAGVSAESQEIRLSPSKQLLPGDDSCPLFTVSVRNRDTLLVTIKSATGQGTVEVPTGGTAQEIANKASKAGIKVKGAKDALALALHIILLLEGFVCYAEEEERGSPTGFAPPIRAVPESRLVPWNWNADPSHISFIYRHNQSADKTIKMKMTWMDEKAVVEMQDHRGEARSTASFNGPDYANMGYSGGGDPLPALRNVDTFHTSVRTSLLQPFVPQSKTSTSVHGSIPPMASGRPPFQGEPPFGVPVPGPLGPMPVPGGVGGYCGRKGGLVPDFEGDLQPGGGFGPSGGNLMGPNHPMFTGEDRREGGGFPGGGGFGMPAPRFDPYGPVIPPSRGGPPARGLVDPNDPRGRGRAFREPDPDHLPPPGGNFYF